MVFPALPVFTFLVSLMYSYFSANQARIQARRLQRELDKLTNRGHLVNTKSTDFRYPLIYGPCRVGGNRVYEATSGDGDRYYHQILAVGMGPCEGIVRQDDSIYTTTGAQLPTSNPPLIYLDGKLWTETNMADNCYFQWFNGSDTQNVCSALSGAVSQWNLAMRHKAYLYCRFDFDRDKFLGVPDVTAVVAGLKCYDPTAATTAYTTNFALHVYDMLTRPKVLGGLGLDNWMAAPPADPRINIASVESSRSYCETKGWKGGLVLNTDQDFVENLGLILECFRGDVITSGNQFKVVFRDINYETVAMDLTEQDIVRQEAGTAMKIKPRSTTFRLPNALDAVHFSDDLNYQKHTYFYPDVDAIADDGGDVRKMTVNLLGLNDLNTLQAMCSYKLERARWGNIIPFEGRQKLAQLEPHDLVRLTHSLPGYESQYLRISSIGLASSHTVAVSAEEEGAALYDDSYNDAALVRYVPPMLDLSDPPPSVINVVIDEETEVTRMRTFTKLKVDFDPPADYPWFDYAKVWLRKGAAGDWKYITKAESDWEHALVQEGETYYVRLQSVNIQGVAEDFDGAYTVSLNVQGLLAGVPANVTGFIAAATGDSVALRADNPGSSDIVGWEVRLGDAWNGGIFLTLLGDPSYGIPGVRPGEHTFWMAAKNNAGNYSATPVSATAKIYRPSGLTSDFSQAYDYTTGTFNNTEQDTYNSQNILKCSHTGNVLTGDWTSPTYDRGSLATVRVWIEFATVFFATSGTWNGVIPDGTTWDDIGISTKTWNEIFEPSQAAQLKATLRYSENGSDWSELTGFELLFFEVYARYFQVKLSITDPTLDSNLYIYPVTLKSYTGPV